jgi:DNA-binding beta-propeller fold protein YncE
MRQLFYLLLFGAIAPSFVLFASEKWGSGSNAFRVLGQPNFVTKDPETSQTGMNDPYDVVVDPMTGKVFVADSNHNRVLRYASYANLTNGAPAEITLGQSSFTGTTGTAGEDGMFTPRGLAMQGDGTLWVADFKNHRILRFDNASSKLAGAAADGVLGQPDFDEDSAGLSQSKTGFVRDVAVDANGNRTPSIPGLPVGRVRKRLKSESLSVARDGSALNRGE